MGKPSKTSQKKFPKDLETCTAEALRNTLAQLPPNTLIVMASDAEGNDYKLLDGVDTDAGWNVDAGEIDVSELFGHEPVGRVLPAIVMYPRHE